MSPILQSLIERSQPKLAALLTESSDEIESALVAAASEAQAQETKAKLRINYSMTINMDSNSYDYALGFSVAHKLTDSEAIPDPNQAELPMDDIGMTISTDGMELVECTTGDLRKASERLNRAQK